MEQKKLPLLLAAIITLCSISDTASSIDHRQRNAYVNDPIVDNFSQTEQKTMSHHGDHLELGSVKVLNNEFSITQLGELIPGQEGAFEVSSNGSLSGSSVYLWVESKDGNRISAPSKGSFEHGVLHFHVLPKAGSAPYQVVIRVRKGAMDERASLPLSGHEHGNIDSPR